MILLSLLLHPLRGTPPSMFGGGSYLVEVRALPELFDLISVSNHTVSVNLIFGVTGGAVGQGGVKEWRPPLASITAGKGPQQHLQLAPPEAALMIVAHRFAFRFC